MTVTENVKSVKDKIAAAAISSGRKPEDIVLVAATKMNGADAVREAIAAGVDACGENRMQELREKNEQGAYEGAPLHFIGSLQKNKVKYLVGTVALIQSVDSEELMEAIDKKAAGLGICQDILLEVNIGGESAKSGFAPELTAARAEKAAGFSHLRVRGLMAVPPICADPEDNRPYFARMKQLFVDIGAKKYDNVTMDFLSMGMSGDFEAAILEGANMVRVGTGIFGARDYSAVK